MNRRMTLFALALAIFATAGCGLTKNEDSMVARSDSLLALDPLERGPGMTPEATAPRAPARRTARTTSRSTSSTRRLSLPAGTAVPVSVNATLSSKTASVGDRWSGTVTEPVVVNGRTVIPDGAHVSGTVSDVRTAERGSRAMLQLSMSSVSFDGRSYSVRGSSEELTAGSPRARNVGAIAGGTAAGALIGRAVGKDSKGALIGGLIGGAAATGAVAASKGYQMVIQPGTPVTIYARG